MRRPPIWLIVLALLSLLPWHVVQIEARRALAAALVTNGALETNADNTSFTSASSASPTANALVLLAVLSARDSGTPATPTASSNGSLTCTWDPVVSRQFNTEASPTFRVTLFRCLNAAPGSGTYTVNFGETTSAVTINMIEFTGVVTTGTNGAGAVVQSNGNSADTPSNVTISLSAFSSAFNGAVKFCGAQGGTLFNDETGFTELDDNTGTTPTRGFQLSYRTDNDTSVVCDAASSVNTAGLAAEIAAADTATSTGRGLLLHVGEFFEHLRNQGGE